MFIQYCIWLYLSWDVGLRSLNGYSAYIIQFIKIIIIDYSHFAFLGLCFLSTILNWSLRVLTLISLTASALYCSASSNWLCSIYIYQWSMKTNITWSSFLILLFRFIIIVTGAIWLILRRLLSECINERLLLSENSPNPLLITLHCIESFHL